MRSRQETNAPNEIASTDTTTTATMDETSGNSNRIVDLTPVVPVGSKNDGGGDESVVSQLTGNTTSRSSKPDPPEQNQRTLTSLHEQKRAYERQLKETITALGSAMSMPEHDSEDDEDKERDDELNDPPVRSTRGATAVGQSLRVGGGKQSRSHVSHRASAPPSSFDSTGSVAHQQQRRKTSVKHQGDVIVLGGSIKPSRSHDSCSVDSRGGGGGGRRGKNGNGLCVSTTNEEKDKNNDRRCAAATAAAVGGGAAAATGAGFWFARNRANKGATEATTVPGATTTFDDVEAPSSPVNSTLPSREQESSGAPTTPKVETGENVTGDEGDLEGPHSPMTAMTSASSTKASPGKDGESSKDGPATTMVNHNFNGPKKRTIAGMSRPMFGAVAILASGAAALGLWTGVRVPELNQQVKDLERQVDRLSEQVDRLEVENDRFMASNDQLNSSIHFFQEQNEILNETSIFLAEQVVELTEDIVELSIINDALRNTTDELSVQNDILNETTTELTENVDELSSHVYDLEARVEELRMLEQDLNTNITRLEVENDQLNETAQDLQEIQEDAEQVNEDLRTNLTELNSTIGWLNASVQGTAEEIEQAAQELSGSIEFNRMLGIEQLHLSDQDALHGFDCSMSDIFQVPFQNPDDPIDAGSLTAMFDYMSGPGGLVPTICLDQADYELFMETRFDTTTPTITANEFVNGTNEYANAALAYMFPSDPNGGENGGITHAEWEAAEYNCQNITRFTYPL